MYKIRQSINCQTKNVIYVVKCLKCNLQGVGHSKKLVKEYQTTFHTLNRNVELAALGPNHFIDHHVDEWKGNYKNNNLFQITRIAILTNLPSNEQLKSKWLGEFEGYWQVKLATIHPHGFNSINELKECYQRVGTKFSLTAIQNFTTTVYISDFIDSKQRITAPISYPSTLFSTPYNPHSLLHLYTTLPGSYSLVYKKTAC